MCITRDRRNIPGSRLGIERHRLNTLILDGRHQSQRQSLSPFPSIIKTEFHVNSRDKQPINYQLFGLSPISSIIRYFDNDMKMFNSSVEVWTFRKNRFFLL